MCAFCGRIDNNFLCEDCKRKFGEIGKVHKTKYKTKYYDEHIYMFKYVDIRDKILTYKFDDKAYYYKTFVNILLNNKKMCEILKSYDIIIPVPIHNKRRKERGYNQTELITKELAKNINGLEYADIMQKNKNTVPQSTLKKEDRIKNSVGIFELKNRKNGKEIERQELTQLQNKTKQITENRIYKKNVLIFDDIYTTGSTANECAKVIRKLNPKKIGILTLAKD